VNLYTSFGQFVLEMDATASPPAAATTYRPTDTGPLPSGSSGMLPNNAGYKTIMGVPKQMSAVNNYIRDEIRAPLVRNTAQVLEPLWKRDEKLGYKVRQIDKENSDMFDDVYRKLYTIGNNALKLAQLVTIKQ
jgi:hypothetical protein